MSHILVVTYSSLWLLIQCHEKLKLVNCYVQLFAVVNIKFCMLWNKVLVLEFALTQKSNTKIIDSSENWNLLPVAEISVGWAIAAPPPTHLSSNCQFVGNFYFIGSSEIHELFYKTVIISKFPTN